MLSAETGQGTAEISNGGGVNMFQDEYKSAFSKVTASQQTHERIMNMAKKKKRNPSKLLGKVLIAAALISILAVTASASEFSWFTRFFGGAEELDQEQVQFLEEKTQKIETKPASSKEPKQEGHTDVLQFVAKQTIISADNNNTDMTGEGIPKYHDIKMESLTLSPTQAKLKYYYYDDMDYETPCSLPNLAVGLKSGETVLLPITASQTTLMTFTADDPLDLYEVANIQFPDGTVLEPINDVDDGYEVSLDSVMTDGSIAYFTIDVTVPEYIPPLGEGWTLDEPPSPHIQWICPADMEKPTTKQLVEQQSFSSRLDDGDNKETTYKLVTNISFIDNSINFASGSQWKMSINGFSSGWSNAENQKKIDEKYAGQDYMLDGEEAASVSQYRDVCWDTWEFTFTFDGEESAVDTIEFVQEPILLSGKRLASIDELLAGKEDDVPVDAKLVSFKISPLSYSIEYIYEDGKNASGFIPGGNEMYALVMKDGTQYELFYAQNQHGFEEPIILANIDYLLLPDGQKLTIPQ